MSLVLDVAWVGVAGVAVGGLLSTAGTAVNGRIARRAAETAIEGAHRQRLWEKHSAVYEEIVREVLARQVRREALTSRGDFGNIGSHPIEETRRNEEPDSVRMKALLLAYASAPVSAAYENADKANALFWVNLSRLASAETMAQLRAEQQSAGVSAGTLLPVDDDQGALDAMYQSREDAATADKDLFEAINRQLSWASQPSPATRRSWALRRI